MVTQHRRHGVRIAALTLESQSGAGQATQHQPRLERTQDRTCQQPMAFHGGDQVGLVAGYVAG